MLVKKKEVKAREVEKKEVMKKEVVKKQERPTKNDAIFARLMAKHGGSSESSSDSNMSSSNSSSSIGGVFANFWENYEWHIFIGLIATLIVCCVGVQMYNNRDSNGVAVAPKSEDLTPDVPVEVDDEQGLDTEQQLKETQTALEETKKELESSQQIVTTLKEEAVQAKRDLAYTQQQLRVSESAKEEAVLAKTSRWFTTTKRNLCCLRRLCNWSTTCQESFICCCS
jgi:hypothetical protein